MAARAVGPLNIAGINCSDQTTGPLLLSNPRSLHPLSSNSAISGRSPTFINSPGQGLSPASSATVYLPYNSQGSSDGGHIHYQLTNMGQHQQHLQRTDPSSVIFDDFDSHLHHNSHHQQLHPEMSPPSSVLHQPITSHQSSCAVMARGGNDRPSPELTSSSSPTLSPSASYRIEYSRPGSAMSGAQVAPPSCNYVSYHPLRNAAMISNGDVYRSTDSSLASDNLYRVGPSGIVDGPYTIDSSTYRSYSSSGQHIKPQLM